MADADELRRALADELIDKGDLVPAWREAFRAVPRHEYIPETIWEEDETLPGWDDLTPRSRSDDPQAWLELCYRNEHIAIQVDDGHPVGPGLIGSELTSSASMPTIVAIMLDALDAEPGHRVLEIGTGTGYNAALLAHRLGAANVTTVEIDATLAAAAEQALKRTGFGDVMVIAGDGERGYRGNAPYNRVISTANASPVPYAWIEQTHPGGRIVTPWRTPYYRSGLLALTTHDDGTATGGLVGLASFMSLRSQRTPRFTVSQYQRTEDCPIVLETDLHPYHVSGGFDAGTAIGLRVPRCRTHYLAAEDEDDTGELWLIDPETRSWAVLYHHPLRENDPPPYEVRQYGSRRLWDEVEAAYHWWEEQGKPAADRWRFTITPDGQHITL